MFKFLTFMLSLTCALTVSGSDEFLPKSFDLRISPEDWNTIVTHKWDDLSVPCQIKEKTAQEFVSCKMSIHGGITRTYPKFSFKIITDKKVPPLGMDHKMVLKAEWGDGSYLRNNLSFYIFKHYTKIPVVQRRLVNLSINGEAYGIMIEQELINDSFLTMHGINDAYLFKSDPPDDLYKRAAGSLIPLKTPDQYSLAYQSSKKSENHYDVLIEFIDHLWGIFENKQFQNIATLVNEEEVINFIAVMGVIQNYDYSKKNYYLSLSEQSVENTLLIPHDLDISWGCKWIKSNGVSACGPGTWTQAYETGRLGRSAVSKFPSFRETNLLYQVIWDNPSSELRIKKKICSIINSNDFVTGLNGEIDKVINWVIPNLPQDKMGRLKGSEYKKSVEFLRGFIVKRRDFLNESLCRSLSINH